MEVTKLGVHNEVLCIVKVTPDYDKPQLNFDFYPTRTRLQTLVDQFDIYPFGVDDLFTFEITDKGIGDYRLITHLRRHHWFDVSLVDGLRTRPVNRLCCDAPRPKVKETTSLDYYSGKWWKYYPSKPHGTHIDPLELINWNHLKTVKKLISWINPQ